MVDNRIKNNKKTKLTTISKGFIPFLAEKKGLILVFLGILIFVLFLPHLSSKWIYELPVNEIAPHEVRSPVNIKVLDTVKNEQKIRETRERFLPLYIFREDVVQRIFNRLNSLLQLARNSMNYEQFRSNTPQSYSDRFLKLIYKLSRRDYTGFLEQARKIADSIYADAYIVRTLPEKPYVVLVKSDGRRTRIPSNRLQDISALRRRILAESDISDEVKVAVAELLEPNLEFSKELNERDLQQQIARIKPDYIVIRKNEVLLRAGDVVTEEIAKKLNMIREYRSKRKFLPIMGQFMLIMLILFVFFLFIKHYEQKVYNNMRFLLLVFVNIALIILMVKVSAAYGLSFYLLPLSFTTIIIYMFLDAPIAVLTSLVGVIIGSFFLETSWDFIVYHSALIFASVMNKEMIDSRNDLFKNAGYVTGAAILVIFLQMLNYDVILFKAIYLGLAQGILIFVFATGTLQLYEWTFGITSSITLTELANLSHPLLRRLASQAPGTYNHSIAVANLASIAAEAIGANSLLARVGGYFHDIGKLVKPEYFIENEFRSKDLHKKLKPTLSYTVILSHVKEGERLARQYKLPREIVDIVLQHHGTSVLSYFYRKALQFNFEDAREEDFRYPGPRPQSREAGIIMIADSVEAAARTLQKPSSARLKSLVNEIINNKFVDGQFDECELTLRDLNKISDAILKGLLGIYHQRIEYPKEGNERSKL